MELVKDNVEFITLAEPGKKIEYAGKVCYKSQGNITDNSYERFITNIVKSGHTSVIEHEYKIFMFEPEIYAALKKHFEYNHYANVSVEQNKIFVSGNIRMWYALLGNDKEIEDIHLQGLSSYLSEDYPYLFKNYECKINCKYGKAAEDECKDMSKHRLYTFEITGSRSFTHQLVRHRTLSFSQESQRYCNYSGNKFNHSIRFIENVVHHSTNKLLEEIENKYFELINDGVKPEDARQILPNCAASTIVVSGTLENWKKFLYLRMDEKHAQKEIVDISNMIAKYLHLSKADVGL